MQSRLAVRTVDPATVEPSRVVGRVEAIPLDGHFRSGVRQAKQSSRQETDSTGMGGGRFPERFDLTKNMNKYSYISPGSLVGQVPV